MYHLFISKDGHFPVCKEQARKSSSGAQKQFNVN